MSFLFKSVGGLRLRAVHAWAPPINGVRRAIGGGSRPLTGLGFRDAVLPHLRLNSAYLKSLRGRLAQFDLGFSGASPGLKANYRFPYLIFQGQGSDWVVRPASARDEWFPGHLHFRVIDTESGHSDTVGDAGDTHELKLPAVTEIDKAMLELSLDPRFVPFFAQDAPVSDVLDRQQRVVVRGIVGYTSVAKFFLTARTTISEMLYRMFKVAYPRSTEFDAFAVSEIGNLVAEKLSAQETGQGVELADLMLNDIERQFEPDTSPGPTTFGGGSREAARRLAGTMESAFDAISAQVANNPALEAHLVNSRTLVEFERRYGSLLRKLLSDEDPEVSEIALRSLENYARTAEEQAILASGAVEGLKAYAIENYARIDARRKDLIGDAVVTLSNRSPALNQEILAGFTEPVSWLGEPQTPLWATVLTAEQSIRVGADIQLADYLDSAQLEFAKQIVARGGPNANQPAVSIGKASEIIESLRAQPAERATPAFFDLLSAGERSPYPSIGRALEMQVIDAGRPEIVEQFRLQR